MKSWKTSVNVMFLAALVGVGALPAWAQEAAAPTTVPADPVIIRANGMEVKKSEFETAVQSLPDEYKAYATGPGRRAFAEDFLRMRLLAAEAVKNKLDMAAEVKAQIALMTANTLANAELERMKAAMKLSDDELRKMYDDDKSSYEQVSARHILVAFEGSPAVVPGKTPLTDAQAKAKAEELRAKIIGGADFAETAKLESDDRGSAARGGDLGTFTRGQMVPEFEKAAFETKVGDVSPVVKTQFGYHVMKIEKHDSIPFDEVKAELEQRARETKVREKLDSMAESAGALLDPAYFGPEVPAPNGPEGSPEPGH